MRLGHTDDSDPGSQIAALVRGESDTGLLKLMARRQEDEVWADAAFCEFYTRHSPYMYAVCYDSAERLHGEAWVEDMFEQMFERAYEIAGSFKLQKPVPLDQETRLVRGWLGRIANFQLRALLRNHESEQTYDGEKWDEIDCMVSGATFEEDEEDAPSATAERILIDEAIETLPEREQLVIRTTFQYYRIGKKHQRLPNKVTQDLAKKLGTTPEYLRKIRERALEQIKLYVAERTETAGQKLANESK